VRQATNDSAPTPGEGEVIDSPLAGRHRALDAKFGPFAGWSMPLEYAGQGVQAEHHAVRNAVGVFDVSHLGTALLRGPGAAELANGLFTNDLDRIGRGHAQYTLLCTGSGGVIDDLIVYRRSADDLLLIPNAANSAAVLEAVRAAIPDDADLELADLHQQTAILAVQGPRSPEVLAAIGVPSAMDYMSFIEVRTALAGSGEVIITVCRTGYTGEHGYELVVPADHAEALWDAVLPAVVERGGMACGLAARDTLRTEMGYPLHGHELSPTITPVEAGVSWAVGWDKPAFAGRESLVAQREAGPTRRLRGLLLADRGIPRPDMVVRRSDRTDGEPCGVVTSGTYSPTLGQGIALALLDADIAIDSDVVIDARGRMLTARVTKPPFVDASPR
jgi:aminomethyltransferase